MTDTINEILNAVLKAGSVSGLLSLFWQLLRAFFRRPVLRITQTGTSQTDRWYRHSGGLVLYLRVTNTGEVPVTIFGYHVLGPTIRWLPRKRVLYQAVPEFASGIYKRPGDHDERLRSNEVLNSRVNENGFLEGYARTISGALICATQDQIPDSIHGEIKVTVVCIDHKGRKHKSSVRANEFGPETAAYARRNL